MIDLSFFHNSIFVEALDRNGGQSETMRALDFRHVNPPKRSSPDRLNQIKIAYHWFPSQDLG